MIDNPKIFIQKILEEDCWDQDCTTKALSDYFKIQNKKPPKLCEFHILSKDTGVFAGTEFVQLLGEIVGFVPRFLVQDGEEFAHGDLLFVAEADPLKVLSFERSLLNGLQILCATARETRKMVQAIHKHAALKKLNKVPGLYHTRKTIPLFRYFQLKAVGSGGGMLHRSNLRERVLLKENHKYLLQRERLNFEGLVEFALKVDPRAMIEVESFDEAIMVCSLGAHHIMLDNFSLEQVQKTLKALKGRVDIELSGGVTLENLDLFVQEGVSRISSSHMTMRAGACDLSLDWTMK